MSEKMKYPILNISLKNWNSSKLDYSILLLDSNLIYTSNDELFNNYFLNNEYIDSNGKIYEIIGRELPSSWKKAFSFIPYFYKVKLLFKAKEREIQLDELKSYIVKNIKALSYQEEFERKWLKDIEAAKTFEQTLAR